MAYYPKRYDNSPFPRPYNRGFNPNSNFQINSNQPMKRRSHCKTIVKDGVLYVTGWKVGSKAGFRTFFVAPAKNQRKIMSKKNPGTATQWLTCRVSVMNKTHGSNGLFPAMIHEVTHKVFIKDLGIMLNPNTGYISYIPRKK